MPPTTIPGPTPDSATVALARLGVVQGRNEQVSEWVDVHFNPASLQLQVSNELKDTRNNERKQYIAKSNAKLTMELQFDTTDSGEDVTTTTRKLQAFIAPPLPPGDQARQSLPPPVVMFEWGRLKFKGIAESYKETIDFFSANGVPLRASVNLTLSQQDQVFDDAPDDAPENAGTLDDNLALDTAETSPADVANNAESPSAARAVAEANGVDNLRFGNGSPLTVSASITLKPPAAFASVGAGIGIGVGAGAGLSIGGGAGVSLGGGAGISLGAGAGVSLGGGAGISLGAGAGISVGASAGISVGGGAGISGLSRLSATEGAFAGLRATVKAGSSTARLNTSRLQPQLRSATLSTDRHASFQVGGKAKLEGAAGLRADVGGSSAVRGKLTFEVS